MKVAATDKLINYFMEKSSFSKEDLLHYFQKTEGELNENTFIWRIHDLKKKNVLHEIKRGVYTVETKPVYKPDLENNLTKLSASIKGHFNDTKYCLWDIDWINEFTNHFFNKKMILIETEKDLQESLAFFLSDDGYENIFWSIKGSLPKFHNSSEPIIVQPLISRAPVQEVNLDNNESVILPTLEKILVDIFQDEKIFYFLQGAEMKRIFENALSRYCINYTTLLSYAKRRGKETEIQDFLTKNFPEIINMVNP
jgi:hypothetical protein